MATTTGWRNFLPPRCRKMKSPCTLKIQGSKREFSFPRRMKSGRGKSCGKLWKAPRRNRLISVAHSKQAALGFRVHSGWAALVAVRLEKSAPGVLVRQRAHLVETFTYEFPQPFHTPGKMPISQARHFIARVRGNEHRLPHRPLL